MLTELFVDTGEVRVCRGTSILHAGAIGSCVVITAYDPDSRVGGMAHVLLPGASPAGQAGLRTRYAVDALQDLLAAMLREGASMPPIVCLVGGANVLGDAEQSPGPDISRTLVSRLTELGITPAAVDLGGRVRRRCSLWIAEGRVVYAVGDGEERLLWSAQMGMETSAGWEG
jgi:chemotaxis protein CheD